MKKALLLLFFMLLIFFFSGCSSPSTQEETENIINEENKSNIQIESFLSTEMKVRDHDIPIFLSIKNDSDEEIVISEDDFTLWMEDDAGKKSGMNSIRYEESQSVNIRPQSEGYVTAFFPALDFIDRNHINGEKLQIEYKGNEQVKEKEIKVGQTLPSEYAGIMKQRKMAIERSLNKPVAVDEGENEEDVAINGFIPEQNRFKITGYAMDVRRGEVVEVYIRVENLTDKELIYDAEQLTLYDHYGEHERANVRDKAFDPTMTIPPKGKVEYLDLFRIDHFASGDYLTTEENIKNIKGFIYRDDQFFEVIPIYGDYVHELPDDFIID